MRITPIRDNVLRRNSNIELLRIIAITLITLNHVSSKGIVISSDASMANNCLALFFLCGGQFGCNIFIIITCWFLSSNKIQWKNIVRIWYQTFTYYLVLGLIDIFIEGTFNYTNVLKLLFPIITSNYWYSRAYIALLLIYPFGVSIISKLKHKRIIVGIILFSYVIFVYVLGYSESNSTVIGIMKYIFARQEVWFVFFAFFLYSIKDSLLNAEISTKQCILISIVLYFAMYSSVIVSFFYGLAYEIWREIYSPLNCTSALFLFLSFQRMKNRFNQSINKVASYSFGIYLFQCHRYVKPLIWNGLFSFQLYYQKQFIGFLIYCLFGVIAIMLIGFAFEWLYKKLFSIPLIYVLKDK